MSEGTVCKLIERCVGLLGPVEQQFKEALTQAEVLHQDATGLHVACKRLWMHVTDTRRLSPTITSIRAEGKRLWKPSAPCRISVATRFTTDGLLLLVRPLARRLQRASAARSGVRGLVG